MHSRPIPKPCPASPPLARSDLLHGLNDVLGELSEDEFRIVLYHTLHYVYVVIHGGPQEDRNGIPLSRIPDDWMPEHPGSYQDGAPAVEPSD